MLFSLILYVLIISREIKRFKGITIQLDKIYGSTDEIACEVIEILKKEGRKCGILETGKEYPKLLVDEKKYVMVHIIDSIKGLLVQVVQLQLC